ncbi:MAG: ImuA family protein [Beijerinckiaceae bacterium]
MQTLASLRQALARAPVHACSKPRAGLGGAAVDAALGGGLLRGAIHEVHAAAEANSVAASGFALGLAARCAGEKPIIWVREENADREMGSLYAPGIAALGFEPAKLLLMRARNGAAALRAAGEAVRCAGLGAVLMSLWGELRLLDLTASRRLLLAAETSGVPLLIIRTAARPQPSVAATRWQVRSIPSQALEANAPGLPGFEVTLQRQRGGACGHVWRLEWNHEQRSFAEWGARSTRPALPRPLVSIPPSADDAAGMAAEESLRRAG